MAAVCNHSGLLLTVHNVEYQEEDVESSKCELPFRPGTKISLVLTCPTDSEESDVQLKIAIEGSAEELKGALWVSHEKGRNYISHRDVDFNTNYSIYAMCYDRVFCDVWTDECPFCEDGTAEQEAAHEKELEILRSQLKQSEDRLAEQRLQAENVQNALQSRIQQLEEEAMENERKLAAAVDELSNAASKQENEQLATVNAGLTAALDEQKTASEALEKENEELRALLADSQQNGGQSEDDRVPAAMSAMRKSAFLTDFLLLVDGVGIPVHRPALALKSAFFESLFRSQPAVAEYPVEGIGREIVERMIDFCYCSQLPELEKDAPELYAAAHRFQVASLLDACTETMKAGITPDNAANVLVLAARHNDEQLAAFAVDYAEGNGGKFRLLVADSILSLLPAELEVYKKIVRLLKDGSMDDGTDEKQPLPSTDDRADGQSESSASSEWEALDPK
ncbi:Speckle-type POZ protein-like isoform X1 [Aphelenchoides fujianensis]|nr:Speckle-type POZ protein-like isoform X1 [Aphelenchoides fujianensis]